MKTRKIYSLLIVLMLFAAGAFMYACTPDGDGDIVSPRNITQNNEVSEDCNYCLDPMPILKGSGGSAVTFGNLKVCQEEGQLCFYYSAIEGRKINSLDLGFFEVLADGTLNPAHNNFNISESNIQSNTYKICVDIDEIEEYIKTDAVTGTKTVLIATNVIVTGSRGGNSGGQGWVGELTLDGKYPYDRTFTFTICEEDGENGEEECNKTQGFWKTHGPGACGNGNNDNEWPVDGLTLGGTFDNNNERIAGTGTYYNNEQLCAIFNTPVGTGKKANGLISLAHQLIAAEFNKISYCTPDGGIIQEAHTMIGNLVIPPTAGGGKLSTTVVSSLVDALSAYNESGACGTCTDD